MTMSHYYSDIGTIGVDARRTSGFNTNYQQRRNSGFDASPAALNGNCNSRDAIAAHSWRQNCRRFKLSALFTIIGVKKSVSARRLHGLDRFK